MLFFLEVIRIRGTKAAIKQNKQKYILDGDFKDGICCCKIQLPKGFLELRARLHRNICSKNIIFNSVFVKQIRVTTKLCKDEARSWAALSGMT